MGHFNPQHTNSAGLFCSSPSGEGDRLSPQYVWRPRLHSRGFLAREGMARIHLLPWWYERNLTHYLDAWALLMPTTSLGGWTLGNINTENAFCTNMCKGKECCHHFRCIEVAFSSQLGRCQMCCRISRLQARARKPISRGRGRRRRGTAMGMGTRGTHARDRHEAHRRRRRFQAGCLPAKDILRVTDSRDI